MWLIYGKKEREIFEDRKEEFPEYLAEIYDNTRTLHDGKWMVIRISDDTYLDEIIEMIKIKRSPQKR